MDLPSDVASLSADEDSDLEELTGIGEQLIYETLEGRDLNSINALIVGGAPLWYQNEAEGISALHAAAYNEDKNLVKALLEAGAVWNAGTLGTPGPHYASGT